MIGLKRVQLLRNLSSNLCNIGANYKWVLSGSKTIETNESQSDESCLQDKHRNKMAAAVGRFGESKTIF